MNNLSRDQVTDYQNNPSLIANMAEEIFEHCNPIEPSTAQATGCFTTLPVRIHKRDDIANEATLKSMQEWGDHIGDGWDKKSGSALSPVGNWCSFIFPESLPERLGVITYLANMGNIHDGKHSTTRDQSVVLSRPVQMLI